MARADIGIRGARVVTAGSAFEAPVAIADGKVVQLGGEFDAARDIDATGCLLLPAASMPTSISPIPADGATVPAGSMTSPPARPPPWPVA